MSRWPGENRVPGQKYPLKCTEMPLRHEVEVRLILFLEALVVEIRGVVRRFVDFKFFRKVVRIHRVVRIA